MSYVKWGLIGVASIVGVMVVGSVLNTFGSVVTAPSRVISKTLGTNNIIHNYEWFHDTFQAYLARKSQIVSYGKLVEANKDDITLHQELEAMKQTCRVLVTKYNANSTKINRSIFRGTETPKSLDLATCD